LGAEDKAVQINGHQAIPRFIGDHGKGIVAQNTGVGSHTIQTSVGFQNCGKHLVLRFRTGDIHLNGDGLAPRLLDLGRNSLRFIRDNVGHAYGHAVLGQTLGHSSANAAASAGDQRDFFKFRHIDPPYTQVS